MLFVYDAAFFIDWKKNYTNQSEDIITDQINLKQHFPHCFSFFMIRP